jgi:Ser/Thr protein kinase RdoA (MazF antagonist)
MIFFKNLVRKNIYSLTKANPYLLQVGLTHNDLHLDNILVSKKSNQLYVIDFANQEENGLVIYDLIYYLSTILTLLDARPKIKEYFIELCYCELQNFEPSAVNILDLAFMFHQVCKTNSRFNSEVSFGKILKSQLLYFKNLKQDFKSGRC